MRKLILLLSLVCIVGCTETIVKCKDSDTYVLESKEVIRLFDCDGIESKQFMGKDAKKFADSVLVGKKVKLSRKGKDKYGRTLAAVYVEGESMANLLVSNGYAYVYTRYTNNEELINRFNYAKFNKVGVFKYDNQISPAEFRKQSKN